MRDFNHIFFAGADPLLQSRPERPVLKSSGTHSSVPTGTGPSQDLDPFLPWLFRRGGLDASAYRPAVLQRRLSACFRKLRVGSGEEARSRLDREPWLVPAAMDAVLLGVSEFFRDPEIFARLSDAVLPSLLQGGRRVRVLSAGCSDGQELYSVAMLLAEAGALPRSELLGVDGRPEAVVRAEAGWYEPRRLAGLDPLRRRRHLRPEGGGFRVQAGLRRRTSWRAADLLSLGAEPAAFDLVLCRNVAIYLNDEAARAVWLALASRLRPGGVLMTCKAGRPLEEPPFRRLSPCLFRKEGP